MFFRNTSLMRRILVLVVSALCASTLFATLAFVMAGRLTASDVELDESLANAESLAAIISNNPEVLTNSEEYLFSENGYNGRRLFIMDSRGYIIYPSHNEDLSGFEADALKCATEMELGESDNYAYKFLEDTVFQTDLVIKQKVTLKDDIYYLVSVSNATATDESITQYVNILLLSTLAAALFMMFPVTLLVKHILEPIQIVTDIAKEYSKGNYSVKAKEKYPGEVGELAVTINKLSDKLSSSINDLTNERNRLEEIFNVIAEGIVVFNANAEATTVNNTMRSIFTRVPKKNMFTERLQLIPFNEVWEDVDNCIIEGVKKERTLEGPDYAYQINIIPKFDVNRPDKCIGATGFFRDISEELKLERTRRDYVANISHELRTPLQTLRGLIEPLSDGLVKKEEDRQRYYSIILNETMRLSRLIDDMLELSKLQSRTLAFKTFPIDMNQLLSELETKFMPIMKDAGISYKVMFNTGKLPTVMGNPDRVEQILIILLDNAKKYTPAGGSITISTEYREKDNKVYISVSDTGQGIHEYDIDHIFDRFFKADRARGKKGTGLGLAIAKELLTYMGEDITVESEYGKGTTFTFTLKKAEAKNAWY